jgi:hypothetical protein
MRSRPGIVRRMSRTILTIAFTAALLGASSSAFADLELPRPSPFAKTWQTVGLTEITVDYSSPGVKGRKIWGGLLPYDELWRAGANNATKVTFSKDVMIDNKPVPAGSYALFMIPGKTTWTVIFNKNVNQSGTRDYKQDLDLLRIQVKPQAVPMRERLAYLITDFSEDAATIELEWEKLRIAIPVRLKTQEQALANIKASTDGAWRPYNAAARYMLESKKDYDAGLELIDRSIAVKEDWQNLWTKASLLAAKGKYKDAYPLVEKVKAMGEKAEGVFFAADDVKKALSEWKSK